MTSKIQLLDEQTINQIAAGEVIENPASVVKELVENALDAKADDITIEIRGGGRQLIRITDNGIGMNSTDALKSLERHATSKIRDINDIHTIHTMGFRGEAVPSIASISKLTILTRSPEEQQGTLVSVEGGKLITNASAERDQGTTMEVDSLFYNVPVRKKFQRSPTYDTNEVQKAVSTLALANPNVKFTLINQGKALLKTTLSKEEPFKNRIKEVLGKEFSLGLCPLSMEKEEIKLEGFIGMPHFNRHNRTGQYLIINGRVVFSPVISYAVKEGYGTAMGTHRHPIFVLHLTIPGHQIDVNVHPQKREVRLRHSQQLKDLISESVQRALSAKEIPVTTTEVGFEAPPAFIYSTPLAPAAYPKDWMFKETAVVEKPVEIAPLFNPEPIVKLPVVLTTIPGFILAQSQEGLIRWINQRNAHARILFEMLDKQYMPATPIQQLLIPLNYDFSPTEAATIQSHLKKLQKWGLGIREFGPHSFTIDAIPQVWDEPKIEDLLHAITKEASETSLPDNKKLVQSVARAAFSENKKLCHSEAQHLVNQLLKCEKPKFCPIGKPTMVEISHQMIAKLFET